MNKKGLFVVLGIVGIALVWFGTRDVSKEIIIPTPLPSSPLGVELTYNENLYKIQWIKVDADQEVLLYSNLETKESATNLKDEHGCSALVNAGFYTKENSPVGLFVVGDKQIRARNSSDLFNGFFYKTADGEYIISTSPPLAGQLTFALQSGPMLIDDKVSLPLSIKNDKQARRSVAFMDSQGAVYFAVVYNGNSVYLGPNLAQLPDILDKFAKENGIDVVGAINLDGGAASAFYGKGVSLPEATRIGSFYCIK